MNLELAKSAAEGLAPPVRGECQGISPDPQLGRQRLSRKDMTAGAPGGEQNRTAVLVHPAPPGRRRVSASNNPMAKEIARSDEPP